MLTHVRYLFASIVVRGM